MDYGLKSAYQERRSAANADLRAAMDSVDLWLRHAALKSSGVVKVTHHELRKIHDALLLAVRDDNPQSLLILDADEEDAEGEA